MAVEQEIGGGIEDGRRRRWSPEEKRAIVELSLDPECSVAEVASCFDIVPTQIYGWRRELREQAEDAARSEGPVFLPAVIEPVPPAPLPIEPDRHDRILLPGALVQVAMEVRGVPVMVAHGANPMLVTSVIDALTRAR